MAYPLVLAKSGIALVLQKIASRTDIEISTVRVSSAFAPINADRTGLTPSEDSDTYGAVVVTVEGQTRLSLSAKIETQKTRAYEIREIGFFTEEGILIGIAGSENPLAISIPSQPILVRFALEISELAGSNITVTGAGTDLNLTASTTVVELAKYVIALQTELMDLKTKLSAKGVI